MRTFVVATAVLLGAAAAVLGAVLTDSLHEQALRDAEVSLTRYTDGLIGRYVVHGDAVLVSRDALDLLEREIASRSDVVNIEIWRADGTLVWTNFGRERIGRTFPLNNHLRDVLETGEAEAELEHPDHAEHGVESRVAIEDLVEVYAPIRAADGAIIGAYEIYANPARIEGFIADRSRVIWLTTLGVFGAVWLVLVLLVRGAARLVARQDALLDARGAELVDAYEQLEQSSVEAIATLNATMEAKDPGTAGHAQRVQRVALAIARELRMSSDELDAVRFGALFHDIGKIAVPDALLTKPEPLTYWEYAQMKLHSGAGAQIVEKLARLRDAVPAIRHHHERWDGSGYPDGLAGEAIPRVAAVVSLAEAWESMRADRPYAPARSPWAALAEIREARGTQFAPAVVDAFFEAVQQRPRDFGLPDLPAAATA